MNNIILKFKKRDIFVLVFTFAIGFFAHSFMIFNKISFFDDLSSIYGFSAKHLFSLGRFSIGILKIVNDILFGSYSSPIINGIVSILFIAFSNILITRMFEINNKVSLILLSSVIILSTGYICLQAYLFTAIYYTFAIFLSTLSSYLFTKYSFNKYICKILIVASLQVIVISIYQSYFLFGIMLFIIYQIKNLLDENYNFKESIDYFITTILSLLIYFLISKSLIICINTFYNSVINVDLELSLSNYQGINSFISGNIFSNLSFANIINKLFTADCIFFENNYYIFVTLYILIAIVYICIFVDKNLSQKNLILIFAYTIVLLFVSNSFYMLEGVGTALYALPLFPKCLLFLLPVILLENVNLKINILIKAILFYYLIYNIVISNSIYLNRYFTLENEKRWCTTLISRIQSTPGYKDEYDIYIYGEQVGSNIIKYDKHYANNIRFLKTINPYNIDSINQYNFESFLEYYSGFKAWTFHKNDKSFDTSFILNMPCYPDDGSIRVIDDRIIVKFSDFKD